MNEVLAASNLDPTALSVVTRKLEVYPVSSLPSFLAYAAVCNGSFLVVQDVLDAKNTAIKDLQYELARVCKAHNDMIKVYEAKLGEFGIPVDELGFQPAQATQTLGKGPAGLVTA